MTILIDIMWYLLIIIAVIFFISGLEEVFFDVYYWFRYLYRKYKLRKYEPLSYQKLLRLPEKKIAIIIPCWHEQDVIDKMLVYNVKSIDYQNYDIFVGVYPNDVETKNKVENVAKDFPHIVPVVNKKEGPTSKSENLNTIYTYLCGYEKTKNSVYEIIVLNDSEDIIHPLCLKLFNYLIHKAAMIQLPVFPLEVDLRYFTHWTYNDEFCENHTKDIIVRDSMKGLVPSAGVGTAFSREAVEVLAAENSGKPFYLNTMTEDYNTSLRIRNQGLNQIFVTQKVRRTRLQKRWHYFGKLVPKVVDEWVATRSLFPMTYRTAVKQKARWVMGITMQEWAASGWYGSSAVQFTLFHDRKALITHFINVLGYFVFGFWLIYSIWVLFHPEYPTLQEFFNRHPVVWYLIVACTIIMLERFLQKMIAVRRVYGIIPAILSIPRTFYANFINMHALLRAYRIFFFRDKKKPVIWDKTSHVFPEVSELEKYRKKLGDLLIDKHVITKENLIDALSEQVKTGGRVGDILVKQKLIDKDQLLKFLSEQYQIKTIKKFKNEVLTYHDLPLIERKEYRWLIKNKVFPIALDKNIITLVISDINGALLIEEINKRILPYEGKFIIFE